MMLEKDIDLPQSLARYGKNDFEEVFLDELQQQSGHLSIEHFCSQGGWPDDDSLKLKIESINEGNGEVIISVECHFNEVVPTGCADIKGSATGYGAFEVVLDLKKRRVFLPYDTDDG